MAQQSTDIERVCVVCGGYAGQMVAFASGCRWICGRGCEKKYDSEQTRAEDEVVAFVDEITGGLSVEAEAKLRALLRRKG